MAAKERKEHEENAIHQIGNVQDIHLKGRVELGEISAVSAFLCDLCVLLRLNQLPYLG
jgi:hypothetical protein